MSHPMYNPYAPQRRQTESDPHRLSFVGLGPSLSSPAGQSQASESQAIPSLVPNYRPQQRAQTNKDFPSLDQDARRQEFLSPGMAASSYQNISRHFDGSGGYLNRLSNYDRTNIDDTSTAYYQPSGSGGRSLFGAAGEDDRNRRSIPSRDCGKPDVAQYSEPAQPKYTSETAANILVHFGLEKDDLEHLISYSEDQITPANLPFILRQIRIQKAKKASDADRPKPFRELAPTRGGPASGDSWRGPGLAEVEREDTPSSLLQSSKVIDYGHTSKYVGRLEEDVETRAKRAEGDNLLTMDSLDRRSRSPEPPVQQAGSSANLTPSSPKDSLSSSFKSILKSTAPKSHNPVKPAPTSAQPTLPVYSLPTKDSDARESRDIQPPASKPAAFERVQEKPKPNLKPQQSVPVLRPVHPTRPVLVVLGRDIASSSGGNQRISEAPAVTDKSKKPKRPVQQSNIKKGQSLKQESNQKTLEVKKKQQAPKTQPQLAKKKSLLPLPTSAQVAWQHFQPVPTGCPIPSILSIPTTPIFAGAERPPQLLPVQVSVFKGLPTAAMMLDYAATTPRVFPHTCSLCNKGCAQMKDWIAHQNTNLHLESCKVLRKQYPKWDGEMLHVCKDEEKKKSKSNSQSRSKRPHRGARSSSRSSSPRRRHSSEIQREKRTRRRTQSRSPLSSEIQREKRTTRRRTQSRSPHSSEIQREKRTRRRTQSRSPHSSEIQREKRTTRRRTQSRSPHSSEIQREKRKTRRRTQSRSPHSSEIQREKRTRRRTQSRSPHSSEIQREKRRTQSRSPHSSRHKHRSCSYTRPHSRSCERRPSRRSQDGRLSSKIHERRSSSRRRSRSSSRRRSRSSSRRRSRSSSRRRSRSSLPRRSRSSLPRQSRSSSRRRSSLQSHRDRHSSPNRSRERRPSPKESPAPQKSQRTSTKAERLAKMLLESSAVQSVPKQSDLETMVKTLAPALLAELEKMKSTPSRGSATMTSTAASSSAANKKPVVAKTTSGQLKAFSAKTKPVKASVPTFVTLGTVHPSLTYKEALQAQREAVLCYEKKEDEKLRNTRNLKIRGHPVSVLENKNNTTTMKMAHPQKNPPAPSKVLKTQTLKSASATPAAQGKGMNVPGKQITKLVKKVPVKAQVKPTCKVISEAQKAETSTVNPLRGTVVGKMDTADQQYTVVEEKRAPQPTKVTVPPQQAVVESNPLPTENVSDLQAPLKQGCPEPMEVDSSLLTEEQNHQTVGLQAKPAGGPMEDSAAKHTCELESSAVQQQAKTEAAVIEDVAPPRGSEVALAEDAVPPRGSDAALVVDSVPQRSSKTALAETSSQLGSEESLNEDAGSARNAEAAVKTDAAPSHNSDHAVKKEAVPPRGSDAAVKVDASPPRRFNNAAAPQPSEATAKKNAVPPCGSDAAVRKDVIPQGGANAASMTDLTGSRESGAIVKDNPAPQSGSIAEVTKDVVPPCGSDTPLQKGTAPPCGSSAAVKKDVAPQGGSNAASMTDLTGSRESGAIVKDNPAPQSGSIAEVTKDVVPPCGSDTPLQKSTAPPCGSSAVVKKDVAPQGGSNAASMTDLTGSRESGAIVKDKDNPAPQSGSIAEVTKDVVPPCGSDTPLQKSTAPPCGSSAVVKKDVAPQGGSNAVSMTDLTGSRESGAIVKDNPAPQSGSIGEVTKDVVPPCGSDPPLQKDAAPQCASDKIVKKNAAAQSGSNAAVKKDAALPCSSDAAQMHVMSPYVSDAAVEKDVAPQCGSNIVAKKDVAISHESDATCKDHAAPPSGSDAAAKEDAATSLESDAAAKNKAAPSHGSDATAKGDVAPPRGSGAVAKENAPPSHKYDTAAKEDVVPPHGSDEDPNRTIGERLKECLFKTRIACLKTKTLFMQKFFSLNLTQLLITNLPNDEHSYCKEDLIDLIKRFGFNNFDEDIYIIPQVKMAFVQMKEAKSVRAAVSAGSSGKLILKKFKLDVRVLATHIPMWPAGFYKSVMRMMNVNTRIGAQRIIYVKQIGPSETARVREALRNIDGVKNFMPLLCQIFVEFESPFDADRMGVWYFLHNQCPNYQLHRLGVPQLECPSLPPSLPEKAMPDSSEAFAGLTVPTTENDIPYGTCSPFYLTLKNVPYMFPTISPWFVIPRFKTVRNGYNIYEAELSGATAVRTVMLTGLPQEHYKHEDVAQLVRPFLTQKELESLHSDVHVLPLQRRAFVKFKSWNTCCRFVRGHFGKRLSVGSYKLTMHFVLENIFTDRSECNIYTSLMRLSNSYVGEVESLAERLLCVEISETQKDTIRLVLYLVSCHATFVNFLPLANKIYIEMTDSAGVECAVEQSKDFKPKSQRDRTAWLPVKYFVRLNNLKPHLRETKVNLEKDKAAPSAAPLAACPPTVPLMSPTAPSADPGQPAEKVALAPQVEEMADKEDDKKVACSIAEVATAVHDDKENILSKVEDGTLSASACGGNETETLSNNKTTAEEESNNNILTVDNKEEAPPVEEETLAECDDGLQPFDMEEFVTVDEVGDLEDSMGMVPSPSKRSSPHADPFPASKRTKAMASEESKSSVPPLPASSRSTRSSSRRSLSSGSNSAPPTRSTPKRSQKKAKNIHEGSPILPPADCQKNNLATASRESYQVLASVGDDQKSLPNGASHMKLDVSGDCGAEPQAAAVQENISQIENVEEEQAQAVSTPQVDEQENGGGQIQVTNAEEEDVDKEQMAESCQTNKDAVSDPPSADIDEHVLETSGGQPGKDTMASGQGEEEAEAHQVIDSVKEPPASTEIDRSVPEASETRAASSRALKGKVQTSSKKQEMCLVTDSLQVGQSSSTPEPGRRRSTRGKTQAPTTQMSAKDEPTLHIVDSVEDETGVTTRATRGKRGRPPKKVASSEKRAQEEKDATRRTPSRTSHESAKEKTPMRIEAIIKEEPIYQVLDQEKVSPAPRGRGRPKKKGKRIKIEKIDTVDEEAAATFQVVDSVEDETDQDLLSTENIPKKEDVTDGTSPAKLADEEEAAYQVVDSLEEDPAEEEGSATGVCGSVKTDGQQTEFGNEATKCEKKQEADVKDAELSQIKSTTQEDSPDGKKNETLPAAIALALDQVSDEEEDFSDDVAAKEPKERAEQERKKSQRWKRNRSRRSRPSRHEVELATLDQVEEAGKERAPGSDVSEGELALVSEGELALDQEEAIGQHPAEEAEQSEDCRNPETLLTLDEIGDEDEDGKNEALGTSQSAKRKRSYGTEDNTTLVALDQVGHVDEDVLRCGVEKRHRSASERISTGANQDETDVATSCDASRPPSVHLEEEKEEKTEKKPTGEEVEAKEEEEEELPAFAGQPVQSSLQKLGKRTAELVSTAAKRSRSESPCGAPAFVLPAYKANNPLGTEFVMPKSGFFCELCSVFYLKENAAKETHCSSRRHYNNLKNYYRKHEQNLRRSTQGSVSD
ncbi:uncharacterized protein LOC144034647 isoform X2 [Vanacampus margaritifer]